eukprot:TRINITY_DN7726_c0_g4_i2.p1 TRINITY_DN7726_c0_g4~~TRINITY_DN7726_c0_g4_i2.p1  ORF type:complete len:2909 (-),score=734.11 TRINITY_DN7726_c0_g4_i2:52-8727(-)
MAVNGYPGGSGVDVVLKSYNADHSNYVADVLVNTVTTGTQNLPTVAPIGSNGTIVGYIDANPGPSCIFKARIYDNTLAPAGPEFSILNPVPCNQPITMTAARHLSSALIAWTNCSASVPAWCFAYATTVGALGTVTYQVEQWDYTVKTVVAAAINSTHLYLVYDTEATLNTKIYLCTYTTVLQFVGTITGRTPSIALFPLDSSYLIVGTILTDAVSVSLFRGETRLTSDPNRVSAATTSNLADLRVVGDAVGNIVVAWSHLGPPYLDGAGISAMMVVLNSSALAPSPPAQFVASQNTAGDQKVMGMIVSPMPSGIILLYRELTSQVMLRRYDSAFTQTLLVSVPAAANPGQVDVTVSSLVAGDVFLSCAYSYWRGGGGITKVSPLEGPSDGDQRITIVGTNIVGSKRDQVSVGGTLLPITSLTQVAFQDRPVTYNPTQWKFPGNGFTSISSVRMIFSGCQLWVVGVVLSHPSGNNYDVMCNVYDMEMNQVIAPFLVNSDFLIGSQNSPSITNITNGGVCIAFLDSQNNCIRYRCYTNNATPLMGSINVVSAPFPPSIVGLVSGNVVINYANNGFNGALLSIWTTSGSNVVGWTAFWPGVCCNVRNAVLAASPVSARFAASAVTDNGPGNYGSGVVFNDAAVKVSTAAVEVLLGANQALAWIDEESFVLSATSYGAGTNRIWVNFVNATTGQMIELLDPYLNAGSSIAAINTRAAADRFGRVLIAWSQGGTPLHDGSGYAAVSMMFDKDRKLMQPITVIEPVFTSGDQVIEDVISGPDKLSWYFAVNDIPNGQIRVRRIYSSAEQTVVVTVPPGLPITPNMPIFVVGGEGTLQNSTFAYTVNPIGNLTAIVPGAIAFGGGRTVTIFGDTIGSGSDIVNVTICGVNQVLQAQNQSMVRISTVIQAASAACPVYVYSTTRGRSNALNVDVYPRPVVASFTPNNGPAFQTSVIDLYSQPTAPFGDGSDVTVFINQTTPVTIMGQNATWVRIQAPAAAPASIVNITVQSVSRGAAAVAQWVRNPLGVLSALTPFSEGPVAGGMKTNITGSGLGNGIDITQVLFGSTLATIVDQTASAVMVTTPPFIPANVTVTVSSVSRGTVTGLVYTYNPGPNVTAVFPTSYAPQVNPPLTIAGDYLGNGADITSVTVGGLSATINAQTRTAVVVSVPVLAAGTHDVVVMSTRRGTSSKLGLVTVYPNPAVTGAVPTSGAQQLVRTVTIQGTFLSNGNDIYNVTANGERANVTTQTATRVTVSLPALPPGVVTLRVFSTTQGMSQSSVSYFINDYPNVTATIPDGVALTSGARVTIVGALGLGSDITLVQLHGLTAAIQGQTATAVIVVAPVATVSQIGNVTIGSFGRGTASTPNAFVYYPPPVVLSINATFGLMSGGETFTIAGTNLGSGSDITAVALSGSNVASIVGQTSSTVTVISSGGTTPTTGSVSTMSTSRGVGTLANAFTYVRPSLPEPIITSVVPSDGPLSGGTVITISGSNFINDTTFVSVGGFLASSFVTPHSATRIVATVGAADTAGLCMVFVNSLVYGSYNRTAAFTYNPAPVFTSIVPMNGTVTGGVRVTLSGNSLGSGSDVFAVRMCGVSAAIQSQSSTHIVVVTGATTVAGPCVITTNSTRFGGGVDVGNYTAFPTMFATVDRSTFTEGTTVTLWVRFDVAPAAGGNVTVPVNFTCLNAMQSVTEVTINSSNWQIGERVSFSVLQDNIASGTLGCQVAVGPSISNQALFSGQSSLISISRVDDDYAAPVMIAGALSANYLSQVSGFRLAENTNGTYSVVLSCQPSVDVNISLSISDTNRLQLLSPDVVQFNTTSWNVTQEVTVFAPDNAAIEPPFWSTVTMLPQAATQNITGPSLPLPFLILDDDAASLVVASAPLQNWTAEWGVSTTMYVFLSSAFPDPSQVGVVTISTSVAEEGIVVPSTLTFNNTQVGQFYSVTIYPMLDFIDDGSQPYSVQVQTAISGVAGTPTVFSMINLNTDRAGMNVSASELVVNATGSWQTFVWMMSSKPVAPVVVSMLWNNVSLNVVPSAFTVTPAMWNNAFVVTVIGRNDPLMIDDVNSTVVVRLGSTDPKYDLLNASIQVMNKFIYFPTALSFEPELNAVTGLPARLVISNILPNARIEIGGRPAVNATFTNITGPYLDDPSMTAARRRMLLGVTQQLNIISEVNFTTPRINATGYFGLVVTNPDGGQLVLSHATFYTWDCPIVGWIGSGETCAPCSALAAICPGGNRVYPLAGWWTPGEFSGVVVQCRPPAGRCRGVPYPPMPLGSPGNFIGQCGAGYTGVECSRCDTNYWQNGDECSLCDDKSTIALLLFAQYAMLGLFIIALVLLRQESIGNVQFILLGIRTLWISRSDQVTRMPHFVQVMARIISYFVADFNASQPGCSGVDNFMSLFFLNIGLAVGVVVPILIIYYIQYRYRVMRRTTTETIAAEKILDFERARLLKRSVSGLSALLAFIFEVIVTKSLQGVFCRSVPVQGVAQLVLDAEPDTQCFSEGHYAVFITSVLILAVVGIIWPILCARAAYDFANRLTDNRGWRILGDATADEFKPLFYNYGVVLTLTSDVPLIISNVIVQSVNPFAVSIIQLVVLALHVLLGVILRPFKAWFKNVGFVWCFVACLLQVATGMLFGANRFDTEQWAWYLSMISAVMIVLYFVGVVFIGVMESSLGFRIKRAYMKARYGTVLPDDPKFALYEHADNEHSDMEMDEFDKSAFAAADRKPPEIILDETSNLLDELQQMEKSATSVILNARREHRSISATSAINVNVESPFSPIQTAPPAAPSLAELLVAGLTAPSQQPQQQPAPPNTLYSDAEQLAVVSRSARGNVSQRSRSSSADPSDRYLAASGAVAEDDGALLQPRDVHSRGSQDSRASAASDGRAALLKPGDRREAW